MFTSEYQVWSLQTGVNQIRGVSIFHSFNPQTRFMTWLDRDLSTPWHVQVTRVAQMTMTQNFSVGRCHGSWRSLAAGETAPSLLPDGPFWRLGSSLQITLLSRYTRLIHIITGITPGDTICENIQCQPSHRIQSWPLMLPCKSFLYWVGWKDHPWPTRSDCFTNMSRGCVRRAATAYRPSLWQTPPWTWKCQAVILF